MPTATPFTALGRGNGFPFRPLRFDVDTYDYWTSLSGWSKTNAPISDADKEQSIKESLAHAMKLYWNLWKVSGSAEADNQGTSYGPINYLLEDIDATDVTTPSGVDELFPNMRTCLSRYTFAKGEYTGMVDDGATPATASLFAGMFIYRMYNNGEFVGYGIGDIGGSASVEIISAFSIIASVEINSFNNDDTFLSEFEEIDYKNINGMDFVVRCYAYSDAVTGDTFVKDIPNLTASVIPSDPSDGKVEVKLDPNPLLFYTY